MLKAYRYRIYPTPEQADFFRKSFGCCRVVYNRTLDYMSMFWIGQERNVSYLDAKRQLAKLKDIYPWLGEVNSQSLQYAVKQCDDGFANWWHKRAKHPLPKRKDARQAFHNPQHCGVDRKHGTINIPKCKGIRAVLHRPFYGTIKDVTISLMSGNRYYASVLVDTACAPVSADATVCEATSVGIDLNCGDIVCSDGRRFVCPRSYRKAESRLRREQRRLSRKARGSKNRERQKHVVSRCHARVKDRRMDFLHKVTHGLTHDSQVRTLFVEDLNVKGMVRNHYLAKSVTDAAFGEFVRQLAYKGRWYGVNVIKIGRWDASSKTCSTCGAVNRGLRLCDREWTCVCCGIHHDRDYNASVNIKSFGLMALPPDRREVKPADCPPVDDRRVSGLRSSGRMNQEKFRGVTDTPAL